MVAASLGLGRLTIRLARNIQTFTICQHTQWNYNSMPPLPPLRVLWDLDHDPRGNVAHIAENGVSPDEVDEILASPETTDTSRSTGQNIAIGTTSTGRVLIVVFEDVDETTVYPITSYELDN